MSAKAHGQTLSVTATVQEVVIASAGIPLTLKNDDASTTLWYKFGVNESESGAIGDAAALRTAYWAELKAGEAIIIPSLPRLYYVGATGETASARILPGTLTELDSRSGLTFSTVAVAVTGGARQNIGFLASNFVRLHELGGLIDAAGSLAIESADDAAGTTAVALTGTMTYDTNAGLIVPYRADPNGCLTTTAVSKYLNLVAVTGNFNGWAVISTATS